MTDFDKNRIAFTIALIASNLALYPLIKDIKFEFQADLPIKVAFWGFNLLLGFSIYLYALSFIGKEPGLRRTRMAGNVFYIAAIFSPLLYFFYFLTVYITYYIETRKIAYLNGLYSIITENTTVQVLQLILYSVFFGITGLVFMDLVELFSKKSKEKGGKQKT